MRNKEYGFVVSLFFLGIITRLPFMEKMQSHWDAPDYTIALVRYSFVHETPSPPGYPLYIALGKFMHLFVSDIHTAIVLVSVLFAGIGAVVFFFVGKELFNKAVGGIASALFLSAPTIYFFGITANPYGILPITASLLAIVVYKIFIKKKQYGLLLGIMFSAAIGIRPQDGMFLLPLFILGMVKLEGKERYKALGIFFLTFFVWIIPTIIAAGGLQAYMHYIRFFLSSDAKPSITIERIKSIWFILLKGFYLTFGIAGTFLLFYIKLLLPFLKRKKNVSAKELKILVFFAFWILPSFLFNTFVRSDHAAHQMAYLSGFLFLIAFAIWKVIRNNTALFIVVTLIVFFNLYTFFRDRDPQNTKPYIPQSYHYSEIQKNDRRMTAKIHFVENNFPPKSTVIMTTPTLWRVYMYYLKQYHLYEIDALGTLDKQFVDIRREGYNWEKKEYTVLDHRFTIPKNTHYLVLLDDDESFRIINTPAKKYTLAAGSLVYVISVRSGDVFSYGYHILQKRK